jgi:hypothetical protein
MKDKKENNLEETSKNLTSLGCSISIVIVCFIFIAMTIFLMRSCLASL